MPSSPTLARTPRPRSDKGFTLIELLVVMIIIGILAAIAIPIYLNQQRTAKDTTLRSDMHSVAQAYMDWKVNPAHTNGFMHTYAESSVMYAGDRDQELMNIVRENAWFENMPGGHAIPTSEDSLFEIIVAAGRASPESDWGIPHEEGEFCIVGRREGSSYDHKSGVGNTAANYNKTLYWDSRLGGLKDMNELVAAHKSGQQLACYEHTRQYIAATAE